MMSAQSRKESTTQFTDIHFEDQISASVKQARAELRSILLALKEKSTVITYCGQIVSATPSDFPRLLAEWSTTTDVLQAVKNVVVSALFSSEEKCTGSALIAAGLWVSDSGVSQEQTKKRCEHAEMESCLSYFGGNGMSLSVAKAIIDLGGLGCRVDYEETRDPVTRVVAQRGKEISGVVDPLFGDRVGRNFDLENCAVIAVAGTVETVSSLHFALESSTERPIVVIAENFLPNVSNTLAETWRMGRGKCLPFCVRGWPVDNFLELERLGILCVSQERGDTISGLKLESNGQLRVSVSETACTVSGGQEQVTTKLTLEISQSLGGMTGLVKDRVKMLVGFARQCARSGVTRWESLSESSRFLSDLYSRDLAISSQSVAAGARASESLKRVLQEMGCVILVSQGEKE